jgi:hypothetical protein
MVVCAIFATVTLGLCLAGAPAAAAAAWVAQSVPGPLAVPNGQLSAVSCVSARVCFAVGSFDGTNQVSVALASAGTGRGGHCRAPRTCPALRRARWSECRVCRGRCVWRWGR